jgi:hypothetical protein
LLYLSPDLKIAPAFNRVTRQVQLIEKRAKLGPFFPSYGRGDIPRSKIKKKNIKTVNNQ